MSNMSYCRFQNTYNDLQDCANALRGLRDGDAPLSRSEKSYAVLLFETCQQIISEAEDFADQDGDVDAATYIESLQESAKANSPDEEGEE